MQHVQRTGAHELEGPTQAELVGLFLNNVSNVHCYCVSNLIRYHWRIYSISYYVDL